VYPKGCPWNCQHASAKARKMRYEPFDYPVCVDMFDRSFCINHTFPPNGIDLMKRFVEAFHKVFGRLDDVLKLAKTIDFPTMPGETRKI
jgi:hypothetical protein